MVDKVA